MKYKSKFLALFLIGISFNKGYATDLELEAAIEASKKEYEKEEKRREERREKEYREEKQKIIEASKKEYEKEKKRREQEKNQKKNQEKNLGLIEYTEQKLNFDNADVTIIKTSDEKNNCFFHSTYNANPLIWEIILGPEVLEEAREKRTMNPVRRAFFEKLINEKESFKDDEGQNIQLRECLKEGTLLPPLFNVLNELTGGSFKFYTTEELNKFTGKKEEVISILEKIAKKVDKTYKEKVAQIIKNINKKSNDQGLLLSVASNIGSELMAWNNGGIYDMEEFEELKSCIEKNTKQTKKVICVYETQEKDTPDTVKILLDHNHYSTIKQIKFKN